MLVSEIMKGALAHAGEGPDRDIIVRNLTAPLVNMCIAALTHAENAYRKNKMQNDNRIALLAEPVHIEKPEDDVPYDWNITNILMPFWLCWKVFEILDDDSRAQYYRMMFEQEYAQRVPAVWVTLPEFENWRL